MEYQNMKIEHIIEWCKEHNEVEWLKETAAKTFVKDGKERRISFIELKIEFTRKFMPEIAPKTKEKKLSMYELIGKL